MYTILGATGHVGGIVANQLLNKHLPVRVVLRNQLKAGEWLTKGADTAFATLHDPAALAEAFQNTEGVFIMTPPLLGSPDPLTEHNLMLSAISTALDQTRPKKIVFLSSIGAHLSTGTGAIKKLYDMEQTFKRLPIPSAGIRAAWFMENFTHSLHLARQSGCLPSFLNPTNAQIPMVAAEDIGKLAARLLQTPNRPNTSRPNPNFPIHRSIELEGPCRYSADDVASILSHTFRRDIHATPIPEENYEPTYLSFGASPAGARMMAEMHKGFNHHHIRFEENNQEHYTGNILLEDFLKDQLTRS